MKSRRRLLAGLGAGAGALGVFVAAGAPSPAAATQKRVTLLLAEDRGGAPCVNQVDTDGDGALSAGDTILENFCDVVDGSGRVTGHYSTVVTVLGEVASGPTAFVDCVVTLADGSKLAFSGPGAFADVAGRGIDLVVTGGTGRYAGVGGSVNIVHVAGTPARAAFDLTGH